MKSMKKLRRLVPRLSRKSRLVLPEMADEYALSISLPYELVSLIVQFALGSTRGPTARLRILNRVRIISKGFYRLVHSFWDILPIHATWPLRKYTQAIEAHNLNFDVLVDVTSFIGSPSKLLVQINAVLQLDSLQLVQRCRSITLFLDLSRAKSRNNRLLAKALNVVLLQVPMIHAVRIAWYGQHLEALRQEPEDIMQTLPFMNDEAGYPQVTQLLIQSTVAYNGSLQALQVLTKHFPRLEELTICKIACQILVDYELVFAHLRVLRIIPQKGTRLKLLHLFDSLTMPLLEHLAIVHVTPFSLVNVFDVHGRFRSNHQTGDTPQYPALRMLSIMLGDWRDDVPVQLELLLDGLQHMSPQLADLCIVFDGFEAMSSLIMYGAEQAIKDVARWPGLHTLALGVERPSSLPPRQKRVEPSVNFSAHEK
jgi:hypothetical protein